MTRFQEVKMRATVIWAAFVAAGVVGAVHPAVVAGQEEALVCPAGEVVVGDLGFTGLECTNCTMLVGSGANRLWIFRSEPTVLGAKHRAVPETERLQAGDVITAIDDVLITTKEGGRRFANAVPGTPTKIGVRRDGREVTVTVMPRATCDALGYAEPMVDAAPVPAPPEAPAPAAAPKVAVVADVAPVAEAVPLPPPPPAATSGGRLGFSITCTKCEVHVPDRAPAPETTGAAAARWVFSEPPVVERIEVEGPAAAAGLRGGDVLTHIDGLSLTTEAGGVRFGAVQPGDTVTFRYVRNARGGEVTLIAAERRWARAPRPRVATRAIVSRADAAEPTRFSGVLGDTHVLVSGGPITVTRTDAEIVIRSEDITVRISTTGEGPEPNER
jgi:membrane-associated protease RseP (regulator of RpoE activity)